MNDLLIMLGVACCAIVIHYIVSDLLARRKREKQVRREVAAMSLPELQHFKNKSRSLALREAVR